MEIQVKSCETCPFYRYDYYGNEVHECRLKRHLLGNGRLTKGNYFIEAKENSVPTPDWCPIKGEVVEIKYTKDLTLLVP